MVLFARGGEGSIEEGKEEYGDGVRGLIIEIIVEWEI